MTQTHDLTDSARRKFWGMVRLRHLVAMTAGDILSTRSAGAARSPQQW